jgi:Resolvase, N terminal domain
MACASERASSSDTCNLAMAMADGKWISYLRVSTDRQGKSGLGIEAQRNAVAEYLNGGNWSLVKEFVEVESGKNTERPKLAEAIKACRVYGAKLVIAKLDRLSRDASFLLGLEKAGATSAEASGSPKCSRASLNTNSGIGSGANNPA